jgi:hypothetical protein
MKYDDYIAKVEELMDGVKADAIRHAKIAWDSGALDTSAFDNTYVLPKIFVTAYARRMRSQFSPLSKGHLDDVKNLENFI